MDCGGAEADRDERFVEELCRKRWNSFSDCALHAAEYARDHGMSTEEAGRVLRYEALEQAAECWEKETGAVSDCPVKNRSGSSQGGQCRDGSS